jgi:hypothetical protein
MTECPASITLTRRELANLAAVAGAQHRPPRRLSCVLEAGHAGLHIALAQRYRTPFATLEFWAYWRGSTRRLVTDPHAGMCTLVQAGRLPFPGFPADCGLPADHSGPCMLPSVIPVPTQIRQTTKAATRPASSTSRHATSRRGRGLRSAGRP